MVTFKVVSKSETLRTAADIVWLVRKELPNHGWSDEIHDELGMISDRLHAIGRQIAAHEDTVGR